MDQTRLLDIFRTALLSRRFEERIVRLAMAGEIPGTLHAGAGQEVCQVAAIAALDSADYVLYGHRGVAYMLARGVSLSGILADMAGKQGATCRGKGGVMHVVDVDKGVLGESGTLGGGFVISVGVGMALKRRQSRPGGGLLLWRRHLQPGHLPRVAQLGCAAKAAVRLCVREQRLGRVGADQFVHRCPRHLGPSRRLRRTRGSG